MSRNALPILVAVLLVLSGCGSAPVESGGTDGTPTATAASTTPGAPTDTPSPSPESNSPVVVRHGTLPFDANRTYLRVTELLGAEPATVPVSVFDRSQSNAAQCHQLGIYKQFDVRCESHVNRSVGGMVGLGSTAVRLTVGENASQTAIESILAHEFVHTYQSRRGITPRTIGNGQTTDGSTATRGTIEGQASYITRIYNERYLGDYPTIGRSNYESVSGYHQTGIYYFGMKYFDARAVPPSESWDIFDSPPNTTEQLVHGYAPGEEPPTALNVTTTTDEQWRVRSRDRLGELPIRNLLRTRLPEDEAAQAAAGWGNDSLVEVTDDNGEIGYVWVISWDTRTDADEFEEAFVEFVAQSAEREEERRWTSDSTEFTVVRVDERTVLVTAGPSGMVVDVDWAATNIRIGSPE